MKARETRHILIFIYLMTIGALTGIWDKKCKKSEDYYHMLRQKNIYLNKSRKELLHQQQRVRSMCHEMKNNYILEMGYLEKELYGQLKEHYRKKTGYLKSNSHLIHTGNISMDTILNCKLELAASEQIHIEVHHQLLGSVTINDRDLNMLLGNLLDNAMEAVRQLKPEKRNISLQVETNATALFLEISNPYLRKPQKDSHGNYKTQKADRYLHGQGLSRIRRIARKYGGDVTISDEDNIFNVKVLLYMRES